mmetsp:Transcript_1936/g.2994  ORF Transcript_1936/g.2994 Transcript_1936/m.2994 type:complete len:1036 (+) Transcript_1936:110-3217(+)|eukprot:CAMPEP_0119101510 /NCGR_PEP_ID=MMETSP1180-20130426/552_1 /TAXON_ID=3052 ORGANISM="Chlamydomonas cf sp, Strain CCMP681" /NCGR_SAMPLE_ID=MMETSP1180 /ASSEMBLY_ACC=CAM_ASM_000741 /LENGTH=1035 /DNA_ID=CAMNT_0007085645 /DNA_START=83 /DNA_END=3190 /DNA_ORIENTATION=-
MPLKFEIKRQLLQRTDRVKGVELHPSEPWLMSNLYNGNIMIYNINDGTLVKSFEITEQPVRAAKFVGRKQWLITGADDMLIRVFNYNTMDKVKVFEAHTDYIRCIAVHPTLPVFLTSSDDTLIKLWDWDKGFTCVQQFEGHSHFVMQVCFNPKDTNTFASASLDRTIKVWSLGQPMPNFTLEGHEKGVNCVDYFTGGDRPYLISGADDKLVKIWDYQTKACVQTLDGHTHNIAAVCFHPELPIIVTGSEDGTIKLWHATTYRLENTLDYRMERVWGIGYLKGSNNIAIGYDEGSVVIKVGREEPVASMDSSGKIIWARHNEVQTVNIKSLGPDFEMVDGERLPLAVKDLGSSDLYPQSLQHNPNGRFVTVCGDGEFVVYTALAWRNKSFGTGLEFAWSADSAEYAIRESSSRVKVFKNFQEKTTLKLDFSAEGIFGGALIGVKSADFVVFYDWEGRLIRRIDVQAKAVYWSDNGEQVAVVSEESFYLLRFDADVVEAALAAGGTADPDGIDDAFDLVAEVSEKVRTAVWAGDCFIYNNASWRLNYCVGGEVTTLFHLDKPMYLLGYLASLNRIFLIDKEFGVVSYTLLLALVEFKTLVMRGDVPSALALLPQLPQDALNNVARFLEAKGHVIEALEVATEPEYRFDLAIQLGDLDVASEIASELDSEPKWRQLGELAMTGGQLTVAAQCLGRAKDYSGMLLMRSAMGDREGLGSLAEDAKVAGKHNVAFAALLLLGQVDSCVDLLVSVGRLPEAALFCRAYAPSRMPPVVAAWKTDLQIQNAKAAEALADPSEYPNLFPDLETAIKAEAWVKKQSAAMAAAPASEYCDYEGVTLIDLISKIKQMETEGEVEANGTEEPEANGVDEQVEVAGRHSVAGDAVQQQQHEEEEEVEEVEEVEEEVEEEEPQEEEVGTGGPTGFTHLPAPPVIQQQPPPPAFAAAPPAVESAPESEEEEPFSTAVAPHAQPEEEEEAFSKAVAPHAQPEEEEALFDAGDDGFGDAQEGEAAAGASGEDDDWGFNEDDDAEEEQEVTAKKD